MAYRGGLSFNLSDVVVPVDKKEIVDAGDSEVEEVMMNYNMGFHHQQRTLQSGYRYLDTCQCQTDQFGDENFEQPTVRDSTQFT